MTRQISRASLRGYPGEMVPERTGDTFLNMAGAATFLTACLCRGRTFAFPAAAAPMAAGLEPAMPDTTFDTIDDGGSRGLAACGLPRVPGTPSPVPFPSPSKSFEELGLPPSLADALAFGVALGLGDALGFCDAPDPGAWGGFRTAAVFCLRNRAQVGQMSWEAEANKLAAVNWGAL